MCTYRVEKGENVDETNNYGKWTHIIGYSNRRKKYGDIDANMTEMVDGNVNTNDAEIMHGTNAEIWTHIVRK